MSLTVLSYGAGQDSTAILYKLALDPAFRASYAPGALVVVCADTGNEHPDTYEHLEFTQSFCTQHGIEFHHLTAEKGFHTTTWIGLEQFYANHNAIGSKAFPKTCTSNLKIEPIYRWLNRWVNERFFAGEDLALRKQALYRFTEQYGKIKVLVGIAMGEEKRVQNAAAGAVWMEKNIERIYPLVEQGIDRAGCQETACQYGLPCPPPSLCIFCPFKSDIEVLWTARRLPQQYARWVELERNKLLANAHKGKDNHAVFRTRTLPEVVAAAEVKYADWSVEQLDEYRFSHGHCVASAY